MYVDYGASSSVMSHIFLGEKQMETKKLFILFCKVSEQNAASAWTIGWADKSQGSDHCEQDKLICVERNLRFSLSLLLTADAAEPRTLTQRHLSTINQEFL